MKFYSLFLVCIVSLFPAQQVGAVHAKILIINSNAQIVKYQLAQQALEKKGIYETSLLDLANNNWSTKTINTQIEKADLIYCIGSLAYQFVVQKNINKPMVYSGIINSDRLPYRKNTYGIATELPAGMSLHMYRYIFPEVKKIGIVYNPDQNKEWVQEATATADDIGINVISQQIFDDNHFEDSLSILLAEVDALWIISDSSIASQKNIAHAFYYSQKMAKPIFAYDRFYANLGALLVITADKAGISRQVTYLIDEILRGQTPHQKTSAPAISTHIILNMKVLKQYPHLEFNSKSLDSINQIIR